MSSPLTRKMSQDKLQVWIHGQGDVRKLKDRLEMYSAVARPGKLDEVKKFSERGEENSAFLHSLEDINVLFETEKSRFKHMFAVIPHSESGSSNSASPKDSKKCDSAAQKAKLTSKIPVITSTPVGWAKNSTRPDTPRPVLVFHGALRSPRSEGKAKTQSRIKSPKTILKKDSSGEAAKKKRKVTWKLLPAWEGKRHKLVSPALYLLEAKKEGSSVPEKSAVTPPETPVEKVVPLKLNFSGEEESGAESSPIVIEKEKERKNGVAPQVLLSVAAVGGIVTAGCFVFCKWEKVAEITLDLARSVFSKF